MPVWSTRAPGDPSSVGHRMTNDDHGRPGPPVCACSTEGLYFRQDFAWDRVPIAQRCFACAGGWNAALRHDSSAGRADRHP